MTSKDRPGANEYPKPKKLLAIVLPTHNSPISIALSGL